MVSLLSDEQAKQTLSIEKMKHNMKKKLDDLEKGQAKLEKGQKNLERMMALILAHLNIKLE